MKKLITLFVAAALMLSLVACGDSHNDDKEKVSDSNLTSVSGEEDADTALIKASKKELLGTWTVSGVDMEHLTFNEDGTGTYGGIFDKKCTFTYAVSTYHQVYNNGDERVVALMKVKFSTGEAEDITFEFRGDADKKMVFHNSDYTGGYSGCFNFDEYIKAM